MVNQELVLQEDKGPMALPDAQRFQADIQAINKFQQIVHANLIAGQDYGVIPGTGNKPTLLKPGAEKIAKLLGLADTYEIVDKGEDWAKGFFRYIIRATLSSVRTGTVVSQGLGECNSMEGKYRYRWVGDRDLPQGIDKSKLVSQERRSKAGGHWIVYRMDNEDIYSQVNTILKMAKKRALVDAALSAGRLSNVFTQDIEDIGEIGEAMTPPSLIKPPLAQQEVPGKAPEGKPSAGKSPFDTSNPSNQILAAFAQWFEAQTHQPANAVNMQAALGCTLKDYLLMEGHTLETAKQAILKEDRKGEQLEKT